MKFIILYIEELGDLYRLPSIVEIGWAWSSNGENKFKQVLLLKPLGRSRNTLEDNIVRWDLGKYVNKVKGGLDVANDRVQ